MMKIINVQAILVRSQGETILDVEFLEFGMVF